MSVMENRMSQQPAGTDRPSRQISVVLSQPQATAPKAVSRVDSVAGSLPAEWRAEPFAELMQEFDRMVGLAEVKDLLYEIYAMLAVKRYRSEAGLAVQPQVYHMIFKGNPGTGKTTVARMVAKLFQEMGVLSKGHLIEAERADLVGEYIGHTAIKTRELIKKAMGGVLFIDEAYSLARGGEKDFGKEAIDAMVKTMESNLRGKDRQDCPSFFAVRIYFLSFLHTIESRCEIG